MIDPVPSLRGLLKASDYFQTDLAGFTDSAGRFKVFREGESPSTNAPYVTIELRPVDRDQRTGWITVSAMFHVIGSDTEWPDLWAIAEAIRDIFESGNELPEVGDTEELPYQTIGKATFDTGQNPVTDEVMVSVGITLGIEA